MSRVRWLVFAWRDRAHWEINIGKHFTVYRWCPGAPCHLVKRERHWISAGWVR